MGRTKQHGSKVAGQLNEGECRFTFIADKILIDAMKIDAIAKNLSYKQYMNELLKKGDSVKPPKFRKNEKKLLQTIKQPGINKELQSISHEELLKQSIKKTKEK